MEPPKWFIEELRLVDPTLSVRFVSCKGREFRDPDGTSVMIHGPLRTSRGDLLDNPLEPGRLFCEVAPITWIYLCGGCTGVNQKYGRWVVERDISDFPIRLGGGALKKRVEVIVQKAGQYRDLGMDTIHELRMAYQYGFAKKPEDVRRINNMLLHQMDEEHERVDNKWLENTRDMISWSVDEGYKHEFNPIVGAKSRKVMPGSDIKGRIILP